MTQLNILYVKKKIRKFLIVSIYDNYDDFFVLCDDVNGFWVKIILSKFTTQVNVVKKAIKMLKILLWYW